MATGLRHIKQACAAAVIVSVAAWGLGCAGPGPGGGGAGSLQSIPTPIGPDAPLTALDVMTVVENACRSISNDISVAVTDREGNILGVFSRPANAGAPTDRDEAAVSKARTGAFFSSNAAPLSSELIRFLSREHFPDVVSRTSSSDLFGIELTNRGCTLAGPAAAVPTPGLFNPGVTLSQSMAIGSVVPGTGRGISTEPGGMPLYRNGQLIGGVGVVGPEAALCEFAAIAGTTGFTQGFPEPGAVLLEGIRLPYVTPANRDGNRPSGITAGAFPGGGAFLALAPAIASPRVASPYVPEGYLVGPVAGNNLTQAEVASIVEKAIAKANETRAAIRLPLGSRTRMAIAVAEGLPGGAIARGTLLALFRMPDTTIFSIDVAATKARNMIYFNENTRDPGDLPGVPVGTAVTSRTIGFGSQINFPSGQDGTNPGPFRSLFLFDQANPCTQGRDPGNTFPNQNKSGIVFFPGATALFKGNLMVGGLGISGDGVSQDDVITAGGAEGFLPPASIRADQVVIDNTRLPYFRFTRAASN